MSWIDFSSNELAVTTILILSIVWLLHISSCITFIKARLSQQGFFGLHFTLGTIVIVVAGLLFGVIAEDVISGDSLTIVDAQVADWLHAHSTPILTQSLLLITHLHDPITISFIVALIALFLIWKKSGMKFLQFCLLYQEECCSIYW